METPIGHVTHYYNRIGEAVLSLTAELKVGDDVHICGHTTDLEQKVFSLEIEHQKVVKVGPGTEVALRVEDAVRGGDIVYKVTEPA